MRASDSTDSSSNWDFTAVHEFLRSSACGSQVPTANGSDSTVPSPMRGPSRQNVDSAGIPVSKVTTKRSYPRLGDFGSLWDLLNKDPKHNAEPVSTNTILSASDVDEHTHRPAQAGTISKRPSLNQSSRLNPPSGPSQLASRMVPLSGVSQPEISNDTVLGYSSGPSNRSQAFTILKRAANLSSGTQISGSASPRTSQSSSKPIIGASNPIDTPKAIGKAKSRGKGNPQYKTGAAPFESSTDADSDSDTIVFDHAATRTPRGLALVPTQVGTPDARTGHYETPPSSYDEDIPLDDEVIRNIITTPAGIQVLPAAYKSLTERRIGLMTKLLKEFPGFTQFASRVGRLTSAQIRVEHRPIHVFVDMSNIMIGFHDSVKVSRNIPISTRIRRLHMSFPNLSLIMERSRPTAKKVLVGSDRLPSIDEAETLGYETNILDRVNKVKHTTPRMSRFWKGPASQWSSNGPEMAGTTGNRWVEQGVDEILHLKILESLLDTEEPATMVLATGDAAEAEFSGGFMRMVERALQRGWIVELVSFSLVCSNAYRRMEFRAQWGDRFRLIELDPYVEELFA